MANDRIVVLLLKFSRNTSDYGGWQMIDSLFYLVANYWVFLTLAVLIGIATGWFSCTAE